MKNTNNLSRFITIIYHDLSWFDTLSKILTQKPKKIRKTQKFEKKVTKMKSTDTKSKFTDTPKTALRSPFAERSILHRFR